MPPKLTAADRALKRSAARAEFRKAITESSAAGQVKIARERGRQRRSVERTKTSTRVVERQASERARQETIERRSILQQQSIAARGVQRVQTQKDLASVSRGERIKTQITGEAVKPVTSGVRSVTSTLFLVLGIFFVLIIAYVVLLNSNNFGSFLGSAGNFIQGLSSNKPLFVKNGSEDFIGPASSEGPVNKFANIGSQIR
jgi:hypothetical protein